nr:CoA ester lyase [Mycolicibacterium baixiangningiae]
MTQRVESRAVTHAIRPRELDDSARPRRTCLSVPGSSAKMIEKAKGLPADEVFLDLEDAVAPDAKAEARTRVAVALAEPGWAAQVRGVRVNDWTTPWTYADVIEVVSTAGAHLDIIVLPKVTDISHIHALDLLLTQLETTHGLPVGRIGIEAQIENAAGLTHIDAIAAAPRVQALVLGPADMMASLNMRTLVVGEQPQGYDVGDAYHHILMRILIAARTHGVLAIDGPFLKVRDVEAFRRVAGRSAALGFDGKWVLHPDQITAGNEIFSPRQRDYDHAELILEAYEWHTSRAGGARGAVMLGDEMIDEASRKMALVIAARGRAAGMTRQAEPFRPPS